MLVSIYCFKTSFITNIPTAESSIIASRNKILSTGMKNNSSYPVVVPIQNHQTNTHTDVPDLQNTLSIRINERSHIYILRSYIPLYSCRVNRRPKMDHDVFRSCYPFQLLHLWLGMHSHQPRRCTQQYDHDRVIQPMIQKNVSTTPIE